MRYVIRNCYDTRDHPIHASGPRPSMYQCVEDPEVFICPGGRVGDRRIRESDDIADLYTVVRAETVARELATMITEAPRGDYLGERGPVDEGPDEPPEPDFDEEYEADRAADRYERWLYGE